MRIDRSRIIVGFRPTLCNLDNLGTFSSAEKKAWHQLTQTGYRALPGLTRVVRRLKYLNAVLVQIEPAELERFRDVATSHDPIEYTDINYALAPADMTDVISGSFRTGTSCGRIVRKFHVSPLADNSSLGVGVRVALIDSGISPHPCLPALSAAELETKLNTMHWFIPMTMRKKISHDLAVAEQKCGHGAIGTALRPSPITPHGPQPIGPYDHPDLFDAANDIATRYASKLWTGWEVATNAWISRGRRELRPALPCYPRLFGQFRLISPLSRSFLDGQLAFGIRDVMGHGTQMASLIGALSAKTDSTNPQNPPDVRSDSADALDLDLVGVAPYAELMVLKCCHHIGDDDEAALNGTMITALDALTYAIDHEVDVLCFGFAIHGCDAQVVNAVSSLLHKLESTGCTIVAPAGNDPRVRALAFPAASSAVQAIAALTIDSKHGRGLSRADYSATADRKFHEKIAFSAFGGDEFNPVLTASVDFGYKAVWGTSVAAAIAAGVYAAEIGAEDFRSLHREYDAFVGRAGQIDVPKVRSDFAARRAPRRTPQVLNGALNARVGVCTDSGQPDADSKIGAGVIRV